MTSKDQVETLFQGLLVELGKLDEAIVATVKKRAAIVTKMDQIKDLMTTRSNDLRQEIRIQQNEHGKPLYSNQEQRDAALFEKERGDTQWQALNQSLQESEQKKQDADAELESLGRKFGAKKLACQFYSNLTAIME